MAKKNDASKPGLVAEAKKAISKKKAAPAAVPSNLEQRVSELEGDLVRLVESIGGLLGEPFKSQGREIVARRQGAAKV